MSMMASAARVALPVARMRARLLVGICVGLILLTAALALPRQPSPASGALITEQTYRLLVDQHTGTVQLQTPEGLRVTSFPLSMWAGADSHPAGARIRVRVAGDTVEATTVARGGAVLQRATLTASPQWFTVSYSLARLGADATTPRFFSADGVAGFDASAVRAGFSPDAPADTGWPVLATAGRRPLAPAPLQVQLRTANGWVGVGLVHVPDATQLSIDRTGAVSVDYPLHLLQTITDTGAGGWYGGMVRFPAFVVTLEPDTTSGLSAYHAAVVAAGAAPAAAAAQAAWWHLPIVDTWGAQMAAHVARGSAGFTAAWVRSFVAQVQQRYGLTHFTLVIDSRWQQQIGSPTPDPTRFGGVDGMRSLIDDLHAMGLRVMLWWPLWSAGGATGADTTPAAVAAIDPTKPGFDATMAAAVTEMLGQGPGDLGADGLKLDWEYAIPPETARPEMGIGDAALYHYLDVIHRAAHAVRTDALVEASAASPQFEAVTDSVRLYDAWSERAWDARAGIVAAAEPGVLIDGDGWQTTPADAVSHALSSAVYGVPALYFGGTWANGVPVPEATARLLGDVAALAAVKETGGRVLPLPGGGWELVAQGRALAQTLNGEAAAVIWTHGPGRAMLGHVVSSIGGLVSIPMPRTGAVTVAAAGGRSVRVQWVGNRIRLALAPHSLYTITVR